MFTPSVLVTVELSSQLPSQADKSSHGSDPPALLQLVIHLQRELLSQQSVSFCIRSVTDSTHAAKLSSQNTEPINARVFLKCFN